MEPETAAPEHTDQDRLLLVFAYLGPLAVFSLLATRREFVKWHAKQGLILFGVLASASILLRPVYLLLRRYLWWWISELFWATALLVGLGILLTMLLCIVRALEGERFRVPLIGDLVDRV
jgi:uncharacterized membrane protein